MAVKKHSISISGHRTSFSLEDEFWTDLQTIAFREGVSVASLVVRIDKERPRDRNLSSALRVFVLDDAKRRNQ